MMNDVAKQVVGLIETYLPPLLPRGMIHSPEASEVLHRALIRDYVEGSFSMTKHIDSPFTTGKGCQLHASYNERDFRADEYDMLQHLQTFDATALPRRPFKFWAAACVYPLPPLIMANWVKDSNDQWIQDGECDGNKGNFSFAILYFDELPVMDWTPPAFLPNDLPPGSHYAREAVWHEEERNGKRKMSDYMMNTQLPYDARVYGRRKGEGIPLTEYQEKVLAAGGWPYPVGGSDGRRGGDAISAGNGGSGSGANDSDGDHVEAEDPKPAPSVEPIDPKANNVGASAEVDGDVKDIIRSQALRKKYETLISAIRSYTAEQPSRSPHVIRWRRVLSSLGIENGYEKMMADEAQEYANKGWGRWIPVVEALREIEQDEG